MEISSPLQKLIRENSRYIYHLTVGGFALVFPLNGVNEYEDEVDSQSCDFGSDGTKINLRATIYRFLFHLLGCTDLPCIKLNMPAISGLHYFCIFSGRILHQSSAIAGVTLVRITPEHTLIILSTLMKCWLRFY